MKTSRPGKSEQPVRLGTDYRSRQQMETTEGTTLAPFAQKAGESRGRKYSETSHAYRTEFQRDRARIIHSRAFRRLEYKTQVFLNGTGDHLRTRLTHSIEVASISRTIARALGLNEDLAEAIALGHDLGHSPFGHSGEEMLSECMRDYGGFDHNRQSLRVVELLEDPYPDFPGLNLSFEVREGLKKHDTVFETEPFKAGGDGSQNGEASPAHRPALLQYRFPSLEAQVADLADEITYYSHDLDDAVDFQILSPGQLEENAVWRSSIEKVRGRHRDAREPELHRLIIRNIIDVEVQDVVSSSGRAISEAGIHSADDARQNQTSLICYSPELAEQNADLRRFLYQNVYYHPRVAEVNERACEMLRKVFEAYLLAPEKLGESATRRIEAEGLHRTVCDYVAGMTDRYLIEEHDRLVTGSKA